MDIHAALNRTKQPVCPYCKDRLALGDGAGCPKCGTRQHSDCVRIHGSCAVCAAPVGTPFGAWLRARLEAGKISEERLWVAAMLGHPSAGPLLSEPRLVAALAERRNPGMDLSGRAGELRRDPDREPAGLIDLLERVSPEASWRAWRAVVGLAAQRARGGEVARWGRLLASVDACIQDPGRTGPPPLALSEATYAAEAGDIYNAINREVLPWALGL